MEWLRDSDYSLNKIYFIHLFMGFLFIQSCGKKKSLVVSYSKLIGLALPHVIKAGGMTLWVRGL